MARPVEFDEQKVLTNAMEQFWKEGYEASSVQKLLDCTGINRGTLYNSFGDKDTFFKSCIDQYNGILQQQIAASLKNDKLGPWEAISGLFEETVANVTNKHRSMGCLLVNSLCESIAGPDWSAGYNRNDVYRVLVRGVTLSCLFWLLGRHHGRPAIAKRMRPEGHRDATHIFDIMANCIIANGVSLDVQRTEEDSAFPV